MRRRSVPRRRRSRDAKLALVTAVFDTSGGYWLGSNMEPGQSVSFRIFLCMYE